MIVAFSRDAATDTERAALEQFMADPAAAPDPAPAPAAMAAEPDPTPLFAPSPPRPTPLLEAPARSSSWPVYLAALFCSVLWIGAPIAFAYGYRQAKGPFDFDPFVLLVLGAMALGPAALIWLTAYMFRQAQTLGDEARRARRLADQMLSPALAAGADVGDMVRQVREEIARAGAMASEAEAGLSALRRSLADETQRLAEAAAQAQSTGHGLAETLGRERAQLADLAGGLDARAASVAEAISQQARMVAEASDLAETQLREAEASLAARAADLTAAAGEASLVARTAGEDLTRHIARLETAGAGVADQIGLVEQGLGEQRAGLVSTAYALRAEQEAFSAQAESQAAQLSDFITQARLSVVEMGDRALSGGETLRQLIAEAAEQFAGLAAAAKAERDAFSHSTLESLAALSEAAARERTRLESETQAVVAALAQAAEHARTAAEQHAESARSQVDQLSEAAFAAGQKANQVFEARLNEARDLIEQSAQMVEQAGAVTSRKLDEGSVAARTTLDELAGLLTEIEMRAAGLPAAARTQAEQVREAVAESMEQMMAQARKASEETQAIDAAFQDRVRRNYEMLSEAVRLMGAVAGAGALGPPPSPRERLPAPTPATAPAPLVLDTPAPAAEPRPRLRLTPTATDEEFSQIFEQAGGPTPEPPRAEGEAGWTWKELLTSIDTAEARPKPPENDDEDLAGVLLEQISAMGIDPKALLPKGRLEEIAQLTAAGQEDAARDGVRRLAPAATRRLARRLFSDAALRQTAQAYIQRFQADLAAAADRAALVNGDAGRIYLLVEAAAGDLI